MAEPFVVDASLKGASQFDAKLNIGIPGQDGKNATISIGTVSIGGQDEASVENVGTESAAVLNFVIPQGPPGPEGPPGTGTGYMRTSVYDPAGGAKQVAFAADMVTSLSSGSTDAQYPSAKCVYDYVAAQIAGAIGGSY